MHQVLFLCLLASLTWVKEGEAKLFKKPSTLDAIYSKDDRSFISKNSPVTIKTLASSVGLIVPNDLISKSFLNATISASPLKEVVGACESERYKDEPALSGCTGFLVGEDTMVTAGHCIESTEDCTGKSVAFDVYHSAKSRGGYKIPTRNVYACKELIARTFTLAEQDFAIIKLEKAVKGRAPLKLNLSREMSAGTFVFMLGHPLGLPMTWSKKVKVNDSIGPFSFKAPLDSFVGNSGSPVFNAETMEVEGILVRGEEDFVKDAQKECYVYSKFEPAESPEKGEGISKIIELLPFLN